MASAVTAAFGVNIACCRSDYLFAKACCASVRRHLGDVPICLFVDGDFSVRNLCRAYGARALYARDVADVELGKRSYGYGLTKMIALWESPFERFLYLDADTIVWGNLLAALDVEQADFIFNEPHEKYTEHVLKGQYFDYDRLFKHTKAFRWQGLPFFNSGVFIARRGLFAKQEYYELLELKREDPSLMGAGEQGMLNIMVFRAALEGRITIARAPLQAVVPVIPMDELRCRFQVVNGDARVHPDDRTVIHWAGVKPFSLRSDVFREPMSYYRRLSMAECREPLAFLGSAVLYCEDLRTNFRQAIPPGLRRALVRVKRQVQSRRALRASDHRSGGAKTDASKQ